MPEAKTLRSIAGAQTTAGVGEETLLLSVDGAAAAATIAVASSTTLVIGGWSVTGGAPAQFRLQQANDGSTFFDIGLANHNGAIGATATYSPVIGWIIDGDAGATVVVRVRVTTPGGAIAVNTTIRAYVES